MRPVQPTVAASSRSHPVRAAKPHAWEVVSFASGRILGEYALADYRIAVRDAAILRNAGMSVDVRRAF